MSIEAQAVEEVLPQHTELLFEEDWRALERAVEENVPPDKLILEPVGEAKDPMLSSLMIAYWALKTVHMGVQLYREVSGDKEALRPANLAKKVLARLGEAVPEIVSSRSEQLIAAALKLI